MSMYRSDRRRYLTADGKVVEEGDPAAASLLVGEGGEIPQEVADQYGLTVEQPPAEEPPAEGAPPAEEAPAEEAGPEGTPEEKAEEAPPADKAVKKAPANKAKE